jgi:hypothetical protein
MTPTSRRALLSAAISAIVCAPLPGFAYSIEPILRSAGGLIADLWARSSDPDADTLCNLLNEELSPRLFDILREEAQKAQLPIPVLQPELAGSPDVHNILYVRTRIDIRTTIIDDKRLIIGAAGMKFQRKSYEALQPAWPLSLFLAPEVDLATRGEAAVREQFARLVTAMQKTRI